MLMSAGAAAGVGVPPIEGLGERRSRPPKAPGRGERAASPGLRAGLGEPSGAVDAAIGSGAGERSSSAVA